MSEPTIPPTCIGCAPIVAKLRDDADAMQREWEEDQSELARATSDCVKYLERITALESERDRLAARLTRAEELLRRLAKPCRCGKPGCGYHDSAAFLAESNPTEKQA